MRVSIHGGTPIAGWFTREHPRKMDNWGYPYFRKPPYIRICVYIPTIPSHGAMPNLPLDSCEAEVRHLRRAKPTMGRGFSTGQVVVMLILFTVTGQIGAQITLFSANPKIDFQKVRSHSEIFNMYM